MKRLFLLLFVVGFMGCAAGAEKLQTYIEEPKYLIRDPHFAEYEHKSEELEREYLHKKISYAEYIEQKNKLDEDYAREVQERDAIISPSE